MLGGGSFTIQNKILPGAYINFVSAASSVAVLSDRGTAAIPLEFGWGPEKEAFIVTAQDYQERCQEIFGYPADAPQMWQVRELFRNLMKGIFYRLNGGVKAEMCIRDSNRRVRWRRYEVAALQGSWYSDG